MKRLKESKYNPNILPFDPKIDGETIFLSKEESREILKGFNFSKVVEEVYIQRPYDFEYRITR